MRCETFRTDPPALCAALGEPALLTRYLAAQEAELPSLADRQMTAFVRRMGALASHALGLGLTVLAKRDVVQADALLTDLFAVATWHGWELPVERLVEQDVEVAGSQRGLLGADVAVDGAGLWLLDHATVALARQRQAGDADWHEHHPRGGCTH